ncbi:MAG: hypothetical protein IKL84_08495 [Clostridia bacterium]|nr:hypothetical protein [Clostridia bacterium]
MERNEDTMLAARLEELSARAAKGDFCFSRYLTPREQMFAARIPARTARFVWGGWEDAERKRIFFVPDYVGEPDEVSDDAWLTLLSPFFGEEMQAAVTRLVMRGSGFRTLTHRDYLGSILALGLERTALGDVVVVDPHTAVLFCDETLAAYLESALERVGNDKVNLSRDSGSIVLPPRATRPISDTIASPRLDCVVAALINLSREKAQMMIRSGEVELDFAPEQRTDAEVAEGAQISLRGYGRFVIRTIGGLTKRGRLRLMAEQYI